MLEVFLVNSLVISIAVIIHYEFIYRISSYIPKMKVKHRLRIVISVFSSLIIQKADKKNSPEIGAIKQLPHLCLTTY